MKLNQQKQNKNLHYIKRFLPDQDPFHQENPEKTPWYDRGLWPAAWIYCRDLPEPPVAAAYRLVFDWPEKSVVCLHVTADERYELYLDGILIGRGSERGDQRNWFFESYQVTLSPGRHVLSARVWSLGGFAPYAQLRIHHGFFLGAEAPYTEKLSTGKAAWEAMVLKGYTFIGAGVTWGTGTRVEIDGALFSWDSEKGEGIGWSDAMPSYGGVEAAIHNESDSPLHFLRPAMLLPMVDKPVTTGIIRSLQVISDMETNNLQVPVDENINQESASDWNSFLKGGSLTIPAHSGIRAIIDLENYYCAYPEIVTTGGRGSRIRLHWAESLFLSPQATEKGNRSEVAGKYFVGTGDLFKPDGGKERRFTTLWWRAGRYIELTVITGEEALELRGLLLQETHYPLEMESSFSCNDTELEGFVPLGFRTLQMCAHETYMDCPYYEQLMYVGDTRLEVLVTYVTGRDHRLPRKAVTLFDVSRMNSGLTQSRYPSRVTQVIPPFSLWWASMVYDYALWHGDIDFIRRTMPGVHAVLEAYLRFMNSDGLIKAPQGWNFMDWVGGWQFGMPPDGDLGVSGLINMQFIVVLNQVAELEQWLGEMELATRWRRIAEGLWQRIRSSFWCEERGLFSDTIARNCFSEHTQSLAILTGYLDDKKKKQIMERLCDSKDLAQVTSYFSHYLFEACTDTGRMDLLFNRLHLWKGMAAQGFKTTPERPEPSRSDCHAWSAHPLYHFFASILGIRPAGFGFKKVTIKPQLGPLLKAEGKMAHALGFIEVNCSVEQGKLKTRIKLPPGLSGNLSVSGQTITLQDGEEQQVIVSI